MKLALIALVLAASQAPAASDVAPVPSEIAAIMAQADGTTQETAYKVPGVPDEYAVLKALGLKPGLQSLLILDGKPYDVIEAEAPDGTTRKVWFDISSFFGRL